MIPAEAHKSKIIPLPTSRYKKVTLVSLPLFASVPGGVPSHIFHPEHADRHITVDDVRDPNAFALEVKGNSMSPRIENGDIIVGINGKPVTNIQDYMFRLNQLKAGDIVNVSVLRQGKPVELIINL